MSTLTFAELQKVMSSVPRRENETIIVNRDDLEKMRRDPVAFAQYAFADMQGSEFVHPGFAFVLRQRPENHEVFPVKFDPQPVFRMGQQFIGLVNGMLSVARSMCDAQAQLQQVTTMLRHSEVDARRRAKYLEREGKIARRLGIQPRPWRGR